MNRETIQSELERLKPWFHRIDLGGGVFTKIQSAIGEPLEHPQPTWETVKVCVPDDLSGKTVLDVGCNAGFYAIEMKRRGAIVTGVDSQRDLILQAQFVRRVLGLDIEYRRMSVYDLDPLEMGQFDVTLALGLIYHCKHLVLALEKLFAVTREWLIIETAIYPPDSAPAPIVDTEKKSQPTLYPLAYVENASNRKEAVYNWFLPGIDALRALLANIGFDRVEVFPGVQDDRAVFACQKAEPYPDSQSIAYLRSRLTVLSGPSDTHPGEVLKFVVRAENTGHARWLRGSASGTETGSVHLVAHLFDQDEQPIFRYRAGAFLPDDLAPGQSVELEIVVPAPESPGTYWLEFDMVSENLTWFEDLGSVVVKRTFTVA